MTDCLFPHNDDRAPHAARTGFLCQTGFEQLERAIAELPSLSGWLHANLAAGGSGQADESKPTKGEPPIPIRDNVHDHVVEIRAVLTSWVQLVAEERDLRGPQDSQPTSTAAFLVTHLPWCAGQLWIDDMAGEMVDLTRTAHGLAPSHPGRHTLPIVCPDCGSDLTRRDGDDYVECNGCRRLWSEADYAWLVFKLIGEADLPEWVPVAVVAERFGLKPATVWKWKQRGLLQSRREAGQVLVRLVCDVSTEGAA